MIYCGLLASLIVSCDGLYDDPDDMWTTTGEAQSYRNIDCCSYTRWVYLSFHSHDSLTLDYQTVSVPFDWDIALHRYDVKTRGGAAFETHYESIDALRTDVEAYRFHCPDSSQWTADVADSITIDMSHMMEGYLVYAPSERNKVLGRWLDVDLSSMPPIYTLSNKVYLLRLKDGTIAAIRFTGFSNPQKYNTKGYISFDYLYPLNFE